jgi:hypothetical protein
MIEETLTTFNFFVPQPDSGNQQVCGRIVVRWRSETEEVK